MRPIAIDQPLPNIGTEETEQLDFKRDGYGGGEQDRREAAADMAQFANHLGGRLILGAEDADERVGAYPGLVDIDQQDQRIQDVAQALLDPRPDVVTRRAYAPGAAQGGAEILVVTIQPFVGVVGVRYQGGEPKYRFPVRVGKNKRYMTFREVEQMWSSERRARILLEGIPDANRHQIRIDGDLMKLKETEWQLIRLEERLVVLQEPGGTEVFVPYQFVTAVWPSSSVGEHTVSLSCALTNKSGENRVLVQQRRRS